MCTRWKALHRRAIWSEVSENAISNCGFTFLCVKWAESACYVHCVVNSNWSKLDTVSGSTREWITEFGILI